MWTAGDVTRRLRRELGFPRLSVKLMPRLRLEDPKMQGRWVVVVRYPRLTAPRSWPVTLLDSGAVYHGGETKLREVTMAEEVAYVHETDDGEYLSLDPHIMLEQMERRDTHKRNTRQELKDAIRAKREAVLKRSDDDIRDRTRYYRKAFARFFRGEETGL